MMNLLDALKIRPVMICDVCAFQVYDPIESIVTGEAWCGGCFLLDHPLSTLDAEKFYSCTYLEEMLKSCTT